MAVLDFGLAEAGRERFCARPGAGGEPGALPSVANWSGTLIALRPSRAICRRGQRPGAATNHSTGSAFVQFSVSQSGHRLAPGWMRNTPTQASRALRVPHGDLPLSEGRAEVKVFGDAIFLHAQPGSVRLIWRSDSITPCWWPVGRRPGNKNECDQRPQRRSLSSGVPRGRWLVESA